VSLDFDKEILVFVVVVAARLDHVHLCSAIVSRTINLEENLLAFLLQIQGKPLRTWKCINMCSLPCASVLSEVLHEER
jgi:hypothetical protein